MAGQPPHDDERSKSSPRLWMMGDILRPAAPFAKTPTTASGSPFPAQPASLLLAPKKQHLSEQETAYETLLRRVQAHVFSVIEF